MHTHTYGPMSVGVGNCVWDAYAVKWTGLSGERRSDGLIQHYFSIPRLDRTYVRTHIERYRCTYLWLGGFACDGDG